MNYRKPQFYLDIMQSSSNGNDEGKQQEDDNENNYTKRIFSLDYSEISWISDKDISLKLSITKVWSISCTNLSCFKSKYLIKIL